MFEPDVVITNGVQTLLILRIGEEQAFVQDVDRGGIDVVETDDLAGFYETGQRIDPDGNITFE